MKSTIRATKDQMVDAIGNEPGLDFEGVESGINWGLPAWTDAMYPRKSGEDHLSLASVSHRRVLPVLSPGINVLTIHPRYWSIYTWLLTEFWERQLPRTNAAWGRFLRPRERIFVASVLSCPRHGVDIRDVAGKRQVGREISMAFPEFDPKASYLTNPRGGYPVYASAMAQLEFSALDSEIRQAACDAPTPFGRSVGLALRKWVEPTSYYRTYFDDPDQAVPADVVAEYSERICLCRATEGPDYPYLLEAFLHQGQDDEPDRRRASLRLICDLAAQTASEPVDSWNFRQFVYYRRDLDGRTYIPSRPELIETARRWRIYQHRELVAWACNRWLRFISRWGLSADGDRAPIPLLDVLTSVDEMDFGQLASELGLADPHIDGATALSDFFDWVRTEGADDDDLDAEWDIDALASEEHLLDVVWDVDRSDSIASAAIFTLLVAAACRMIKLEHQMRYAHDWHLVRAGGRRRLAVDRLLENFRHHLATNATVSESASWFLEHYVIRQHHRTAMTKLPDDTFRLRMDVERVSFIDEPVGVEFNDSRFRALSTCAAELGLVKPLDEPGHSLTRMGATFLKAGDLPRPSLDVASP